MKRLALTLAFSVCGLAVVATAQQAAPPAAPPIDTIRIFIPADSGGIAPYELRSAPSNWLGSRGIRQELIESERLFGLGRYQDVIDFLLPVWKKEIKTPDDAIASALKRAYRSLKDYGGLQTLLRQQIAVEPQDATFPSELAEAYFLNNMNDSGRVVLERLIAADPKDPDRHNLAAQTYMRVGRSNEGLEIYLEARKALNDSSAFAEEMARMYEARREYAAAIGEYFRWLNSNPASQQQVQKYITNLVKLPEAAPQITEAVQKIVKSFPKHEYAHRLYGDLLFESHEPDSAFSEYKRADELSTRPGQHRLYGIERALETKQYAVARSEAISFLKDYPKHTDLNRVNIALANAELALGHPDIAVGMLKTLAAQIPNEQERLHICYEVGEVYRRYTSEKDSARTYFQQVTDSPARVAERAPAWLRLADIEVFEGHLADADSALRHAFETGNQSYREEIAYRQAELLFLQGNYDQCAAKMKDFMHAFPRGLYVNDAISMVAMIQDGQGSMNWPLQHFSHGLLMLRREMRDSALAEFSALSADSANGLADDAQLAMGEVFEASRSFPEAIEAYRAVATRFPESFLVPRAWDKIGSIYADSLNNPAEARAAFQVILSDYKSSPIVEEARRRLQTLVVP
jgi:tetratricopeptide (TPR) repeat protein